MLCANTKKIGQLGENLAVEFLKKRGYAILERNFSCALGEIDLIARQNGTIVFVEVKSRSSTLFGLPQEAVNFEKRRKISQVALLYINKNNLSGVGMRFDVISITFDRLSKVATISLIKNAF